MKEIGEDGRVKAAYFNPKPINVFHGRAQTRERRLNVVREPRDLNYPGSKYLSMTLALID